ncbi:DUF1684 domain-containing protein [Allobranchiibius sp. GilTou73]|uniref:DUF1684 domain-containing protein n=1 Tax=Allobranchiibius sp. GilTou73 TaxID=2904523 RepID=UPI001F3CD971|nr:DUF1684 domain-containing protein [Allobranchiibius sp. GilTou73]UIJ34848.1 DUF1684 domain-containing protein [Allobranchiibius sp. GilTou73]
MDSRTALQLSAWRREVAQLYAQVRVSADAAEGHARWRAGRESLFLHHSQSPLAAGDPLRRHGIPVWPYDPALRWTLPLEPAGAPQQLAIDSGADGSTSLSLAGWITLPDPFDARVAVWWLDQYAGGLFLPLRDGTAGSTSYGGGRYLLDTAKGADLGGAGQEMVVDLNFLYHPSCRYDDRWVCPLAPAQNIIEQSVEAGERMP